ncbi:unnamed protein product [Owenia fusiformis]|uniref:Uncharacterized protein n=1 Tax=Owenia fusiformis TaxID=6347 RepID=A0A8S4N2Y2_OWEFU|nr:unnamed protein product [Owenia fusiformis]
MTGLLDSCEAQFGTRNLYLVLKIRKESTPQEVKRGYHRLSLSVHPDRVPEDEKEEATKKFQTLGKIYSILSDKDKRALYDESGEIDDENDVPQDRDWYDYWRLMFSKVSVKDIEEFEEKYKGSDEEKDDLKAAYCDYEGDMDMILDSVMCATVDDETRFRKILKDLIQAKEIPAYKAFTKEKKTAQTQRKKKATKEAKEAEAAAAELGVNGMDSLQALIQSKQNSRQQGMDDFFSQFNKMMLVHTVIVLFGMWAVAHAGGLGDWAENRGVKVPKRGRVEPHPDFKGCRISEGRYKVAEVPGKPNEIDECVYYECLGNEWKRKVCQDKLGVLEDRFNEEGRTNSFPCVKPSNKCLSTLSERGVASVYGSIVRDFLYFNTYNSARMVRKAIDEMPLDAKPCATHTFEALRHAREVHLTEENGRRNKGADIRDCAVLLMTDGYTHPQIKKSETIREANNIRKICALILVTLPNSPEEEKEMSEKQREKLREEEFSKIQPDKEMRIDLTSFDELEENINNIARKTCQPVNRV